MFIDHGLIAYELPNNDWPRRYLWPFEVSRPKRLRDMERLKRERIDLVLSRIDAAEL